MIRKHLIFILAINILFLWLYFCLFNCGNNGAGLENIDLFAYGILGIAGSVINIITSILMLFTSVSVKKIIKIFLVITIISLICSILLNFIFVLALCTFVYSTLSLIFVWGIEEQKYVVNVILLIIFIPIFCLFTTIVKV